MDHLISLFFCLPVHTHHEGVTSSCHHWQNIDWSYTSWMNLHMCIFPLYLYSHSVSQFLLFVFFWKRKTSLHKDIRLPSFFIMSMGTDFFLKSTRGHLAPHAVWRLHPLLLLLCQVALPRSHRRRVWGKKSLLCFHTFKVRNMDGEQKVERGRVMERGYIRTVSECKRGAFL